MFEYVSDLEEEEEEKDIMEFKGTVWCAERISVLLEVRLNHFSFIS